MFSITCTCIHTLLFIKNEFFVNPIFSSSLWEFLAWLRQCLAHDANFIPPHLPMMICYPDSYIDRGVYVIVWYSTLILWLFNYWLIISKCICDHIQILLILSSIVNLSNLQMYLSIKVREIHANLVKFYLPVHVILFIASDKYALSLLLPQDIDVFTMFM